MTNKTPEQEAEKVAREWCNNYAFNGVMYWTLKEYVEGKDIEEYLPLEFAIKAHLAGQAVGEQRKQAEIERLNALLKQTEYMLLKADEREESAERRGEERGWKAARRATNGCVISMDYSEGGGPRFVAISDWRASEEYKEEE